MLEELRDIMQRRGDAMRAKAYENATTQIMLLKKDIVDPKKDLKDVQGIGKTITEKIDTFLKTGTLEILERERVNPVNIFTKVYGIGPKKAEELVKNNITTIDEVRENLNMLNDKQKIGIKYYNDILQRIPRSEIDDFYIKLSLIFEEFKSNGSRFEICGSYRRECNDSGDIDVIITNDNNDSNVFGQLLDWLKYEKYIIDDGFLSRGDIKSLTIMDIYPEKENTIKRRVDFFYTPPQEYAFAILYFTGSKIFNTVMRQRAVDMGYTLNEHGICYFNNGIKGKKVEKEFLDEKSIFDFLNMKYKRPCERIDYTSVESIEKSNDSINSNQSVNRHNKTLKRLKIVKPDYIQKFKDEGVSLLATMTKEELISMIQTLNQSYYVDSDQKKELLSDNQYDIIKEYFEKKYPDIDPNTINHASCEIKQIEKNKVELPYELWSMDKIKPDTNAVKKWIQKYKGPYVVSCKLDGISGLYTNKEGEERLYTRGNGKEGQDISSLIKYIIWKGKDESKISFTENVVLRGEIIIKPNVFKEKYEKDFANPRNFVSGIVNKKTIDPNVLIDLDFIPYEVIEPKMKPSIAMNYIQEKWIDKGVKYTILDKISNENLSQILLEWRDIYDYEIDGIIIVNDEIYQRPNKNPEYAFAFKMVISDEVAEAKVLEVIWTPSKDGYLKPRIKIEPIHLDGVVIEYATGFNAQFVNDNKIGVGSVITIRRSGKVIPHIVNVVQPAEKSMMPNMDYEWNETGVDIILKNSDEDNIVKQKNIAGFFKTLDITGIGLGNIKRIMDTGYDSVEKILFMKEDDFLKVDGFKAKMAANLYKAINDKINGSESVKAVKLTEIMTASNIFGRGFGEKRFKCIIDKYPDILTSEMNNNEKISLVRNVDGIALKTAEQFVINIPKFIQFIKSAGLENKLKKIDSENDKKIDKDHPLYGKKIVMTGFRDKELAELIKSYGGENEDIVTKNTFVVLVKNKDEDTGKALLAKKLDIDIMLPDEFKEKFI